MFQGYLALRGFALAGFRRNEQRLAADKPVFANLRLLRDIFLHFETGRAQPVAEVAAVIADMVPLAEIAKTIARIFNGLREVTGLERARPGLNDRHHKHAKTTGLQHAQDLCQSRFVLMEPILLFFVLLGIWALLRCSNFPWPIASC